MDRRLSECARISMKAVVPARCTFSPELLKSAWLREFYQKATIRFVTVQIPSNDSVPRKVSVRRNNTGNVRAFHARGHSRDLLHETYSEHVLAMQSGCLSRRQSLFHCRVGSVGRFENGFHNIDDGQSDIGSARSTLLPACGVMVSAASCNVTSSICLCGNRSAMHSIET
jgi:hypothetical protein